MRKNIWILSARQCGTEPDELFDKSHSFYIAVIQAFPGLLLHRGSAFSFLWKKKPNMPGIYPMGMADTNSFSKSGRKSDH